jgi:transcription initiation factor TFIIIB Brf1 subunit/transcription initiation factor TFIIB
VNLIDRFLEKMQVTKENLQLVGVSAMLIACKYEEIWPPLIKDYIHISDNAYTKEKIIQMENSMLSELDFNIDIVTPYSFLERFVQITGVDKVTQDLAQYMIEISLLDYSSIYIKPSQ